MPTRTIGTNSIFMSTVCYCCDRMNRCYSEQEMRRERERVCVDLNIPVALAAKIYGKILDKINIQPDENSPIPNSCPHFR